MLATLNSLQILVTRSSDQSTELAKKLQELGAQAIEIPVISIEPPDSYELLDKSLSSLESYDWIIFASTNALKFFLNRLHQLSINIDKLHSINLATIGPSTTQALADTGLRASFCPDRFIAEEFVSQFPGYPKLIGQKILWPRTNIGRTFIADKLREAHATVDIVQAYKTTIPANSQATSQQLINLLCNNKKVDIITLASAQTVSNLAILIEQGIQRTKSNKSIASLLEKVAIVSIGPETSTAIENYLGKVPLEANPYTTDGMLIAIKKYVQVSKKLSSDN